MPLSSDCSFSLFVSRLPHALDLPLPAYETPGSAGMDLHAAFSDPSLILSPGKRVLIPSGLVFEIPKMFEGQIRPRSGLALKYGITCLNTPGTIDSDYRGEIKILLINLGEEDFTILRGMRIAQIVFSRVEIAQVKEHPISDIDETLRGSHGFGSTGVF